MTERSRALRSTLTEEGAVTLGLVLLDRPEPGADDVVIRVEAAPINPSDLGMMFAGADLASLDAARLADGPAVTAQVSAGALSGLAGRFGQPMPVGNEGAGVVVATGASREAKALAGKTVAVLAGGMYAQHRRVRAQDCLVLEEGTDPRDAASCFVNPLTALGMVDTMRLEGHHGLVHTAAASNLGQMLNRICLAEDVPLVCIVRREEQAALLRSQGATHVVVSSAPTYADDLFTALVETGSTIAFDAIGGGSGGSEILAAMEKASSAGSTEYSRYGSTTHKQLYIYGGLDRSPTHIDRTYGMAWSIGGWLLPPFLERVGPERAETLRRRVAAELTTTFASSYTATLSLDEVVDVERVRGYTAMATGEKVLVTPHR